MKKTNKNAINDHNRKIAKQKSIFAIIKLDMYRINVLYFVFY